MRAMITKSASVRASTAALMRSTISSLRHELLAGPVAAALRAPGPRCASPAAPDLISDFDRARDVEGAAPAGIDVDQQRQVAHVGDAADVGEHVVERADAEIGQPERAGGDAAAGEVERAEAGALGEQRGVGVDRARRSAAAFPARSAVAKARPADDGVMAIRAATPRRRALLRAPSASRPSSRGEKSSISRPLTIWYWPPAVVTGKPKITSFRNAVAAVGGHAHRHPLAVACRAPSRARGRSPHWPPTPRRTGRAPR